MVQSMIALITGTLESLEGGMAIVLPPGIGLGFEVLLPAYEAEALATQVGRPITLRTMAYLESHGQGASMTPRLIGFESAPDRRFFELFTTVKGLGNRKALRALIMPPAQVAALIRARDVKGLQRMPEVGKRLAETIIAELSGKVDDYLDPSAPSAGGAGATPRMEPKSAAGGGPAGEAIAALIALGETTERAEELVQRARARLDESASADEIVSAAFAGDG